MIQSNQAMFFIIIIIVNSILLLLVHIGHLEHVIVGIYMGDSEVIQLEFC